jgi:hypothetical protein
VSYRSGRFQPSCRCETRRRGHGHYAHTTQAIPHRTNTSLFSCKRYKRLPVDFLSMRGTIYAISVCEALVVVWLVHDPAVYRPDCTFGYRRRRVQKLQHGNFAYLEVHKQLHTDACQRFVACNTPMCIAGLERKHWVYNSGIGTEKIGPHISLSSSCIHHKSCR